MDISGSLQATEHVMAKVRADKAAEAEESLSFSGLTQYRKILPTTYIMSGPVSICF